MKLHEWIYGLVEEVCYDREYVYASFIRHFGRLTEAIYVNGRSVCEGRYEMIGMKSDRVAEFEWQLDQCVNLIRLNSVRLTCTVRSTVTGAAQLQETRRFEMSTGDEIAGPV